QEYLRQVPEPEQPFLLEKLLRLDLHFRQKAGELPTLDDYLPRLAAHAAQVQRFFAALDGPTLDQELPLSHSPEQKGFLALAKDSAGPAPPASAGTSGNDSQLPAIPGYEISPELGRGAFGVVYLARHVQLNRQVALKMILSGRLAGPD